MARGGYRPGSGRKKSPTTLQREEERARKAAAKLAAAKSDLEDVRKTARRERRAAERAAARADKVCVEKVAAMMPPPVAKEPEPVAEPPVAMQAKPPVVDPNLQPLDYLLSIMRDGLESPDRRDKAAQLALPYCHPRLEPKGEGKKAQTKAAAEEVAGKRKFAPPAPPKLAVDNTK